MIIPLKAVPFIVVMLLLCVAICYCIKQCIIAEKQLKRYKNLDEGIDEYEDE